jgi:hypothetical protein
MDMHVRYPTIEFELKDALLVSIELNNESKTVGKSLYCMYVLMLMTSLYCSSSMLTSLLSEATVL